MEQSIFRNPTHTNAGRSDRTAGDRRRHREKVREAIHGNIADIISDESIIGQRGDKIVRVPLRGVREYRFIRGKPGSGVSQGDGDVGEGQVVGKVKKPGEGGDGDKAGTQPGEDYYETDVTLDELLDIVFEDLELPDMDKKKLRMVETKTAPKRLGYRRSGPETHRDMRRTAIERLRRFGARKRALPKLEEIVMKKTLDILHSQADIENQRRAAYKAREAGDRAQVTEHFRLAHLAVLETRRLRVAAAPLRTRLAKLYEVMPLSEVGPKYREYIRKNPKDGGRFPFENDDLRYKKHVTRPKMESNAVVICIMDTSGSMDTMKKYFARMFFFLLYSFIQRRYSQVEVVFVAHTTESKEVTEQEFFFKGESGGTYISSGYQRALDIIEDRYHPDLWNIYAFHCSDGDNFDNDNKKAVGTANALLDICNLFGYVEIKPKGSRYFEGSMIKTFEKLLGKRRNFHALSIESKDEVWPQLSSILKEDERRHS
ncbi:MAG: YeaH/YhbH family protein [bacterium]|nr:YeaH/YhbH family protein [bacterium]